MVRVRVRVRVSVRVRVRVRVRVSFFLGLSTTNVILLQEHPYLITI